MTEKYLLDGIRVVELATFVFGPTRRTRHMSRRVAAARSIFLALLLPSAAIAQGPPADLILVNGKLFTGDPTMPSAAAVAIRGERIIAVGTSTDIAALAGPATGRIDLRGRLVIPGFNDAHMHFVPYPKGVRLKFANLEPSWDETEAALGAAIARAPAGKWVFGVVGWNVAINTTVTRLELDRLAPQNPVLLYAHYGHGQIFNSQAMGLVGIGESEPDPAGGYFERVAGSNEVNGRAWEYAQWRVNRTLIDQIPDVEAIAALRAMANEAAAFGITTVQVFPGSSIDRFVRLLDAAKLPIRVRAMALSLTTPKGRDLTEIRGLSKLRAADPNVTVSGIKWILDGTPFERGAALRQPYNDRVGWRGKLNFPESEVAAMLDESLELNQPLLLHCAGDQPVEVVFDAMEGYRTKVDWPAKRVRIEHGDGVVADLIPRAKKLGVVVVQNPSHFVDAELFRQRWGPDMQPLRALLDAGIPLALGSDGPMNPFLNILFATTHPYAPTQAITREQAVIAYTHGSAFAEFTDDRKGTIAAGKLADLAVLSQDILTMPAPQLPQTRSVLTIVGGRVVFDGKVLAE